MTNEQTYLSDQDVLNGVSDAGANSGGAAAYAGGQAAANDGRVAPLDGNALPAGARHAAPLQVARGLDPSLAFGTSPLHPFGMNNERLEELRPDLVNALRELEVEYRQEGIVARRHEIRRVAQGRPFLGGLQ